MRKFVAVLIMVFVTLFFYKSLQYRQPAKKVKKDTPQIIAEMKESVETQYPDNPNHVMEFHNETVNILYGKEISNQDMLDLINIQRDLYAKEFLDLNPLEDHIMQIENELLVNAEKETKVISSKIESSQGDAEGTTRVRTIHYTNKQNLLREYILKEEYDELAGQKKWKIYGWNNIGVAEPQEDTE